MLQELQENHKLNELRNLLQEKKKKQTMLSDLIFIILHKIFSLARI